MKNMATHSLAVTSGATEEEITMQKLESPIHRDSGTNLGNLVKYVCVLK